MCLCMLRYILLTVLGTVGVLAHVLLHYWHKNAWYPEDYSKHCTQKLTTCKPSLAGLPATSLLPIVYSVTARVLR